MKFKAEIEIHHEHLKVLFDYHNKYELNDEYFNLMNRQDIEEEMVWKLGLLEGGFYQHYPLQPTRLGSFILELYLKQRPKNPSAYERLMEKMELEGRVKTIELPIESTHQDPPTYGITNDNGIFPSEDDVYLK